VPENGAIGIEISARLEMGRISGTLTLHGGPMAARIQAIQGKYSEASGIPRRGAHGMADFGSVAAIGTSLSRAQFEAAYQGAVLGQLRDAIDLEGQLAVQLIQSAVVAGGDVGQNLDISV